MKGLNPVVLLSINADRISGAALSVPEFKGRKVIEYEAVRLGEVKRQHGRDDWAKNAVAEAEYAGLPLVVIGSERDERRLSAAVLARLHQDWGQWLAAFERAGIPETHILTVPVKWLRSAPSYRSKDFFGKLSSVIEKALHLRVWAETSAEVATLIAHKKKKAA